MVKTAIGFLIQVAELLRYRKVFIMAELHLKGYLTGDYYGIIALTDRKFRDDDTLSQRYGSSIIESIEDFAREQGMTGEHRKGLGGRVSYIEDCNLRIYFTNKKCKLEEAMLAMDNYMYGGDLKTRVNWCGYSEYTITGLNLDTFTIGGHDLDSILCSHIGEYCHIIIEA